jgi:hypothetical protein
MTPVSDVSLEQEARQVGQEALTVVQQANGLEVVDFDSRNRAAELGRVVAGLDKQAKEKFDAIKEPLNRAKDEILAWEHSVRDPLATAKTYLSKQIGGFDAEQEKCRRAEEARLQEEARKEAEAEARRLAQEQAINDAVELEAAGDKAGAQAVLNNPVPVAVYVPPVIVPRLTPKTDGVSTSTNWTFRITNEALVPRDYLVIDEKKIRAVVKALKNKANIPGIEAYPESGARFRS